MDWSPSAYASTTLHLTPFGPPTLRAETDNFIIYRVIFISEQGYCSLKPEETSLSFTLLPCNKLLFSHSYAPEMEALDFSGLINSNARPYRL